MSLKSKAISGVKWTTISTVVIVAFQTLQLVFLARLLDTASFGLIGMVTVITALSEIFMDLGISNAIIQRKSVTPKDLNALYWFNIVAGIAISLIIFITAPLIAAVFKQNELLPLTRLISVIYLIVPFGQLYKAMLQKELKFNSITKAESASVIVGTLVTLFFAYTGHGVISIIYGQIIAASLKTFLYNLYGRNFFKPLFFFRFKHVKEYLKFGLYQAGESLTNYVNTNIDTLSIGKLLGASALGLYNLAFNIVIIPSTKINPIITRVLFPVFSKIQDQNEKLKAGFYKLLTIVGLINFPLFFGLFVTAPTFVLVVFGSKWMDSVPLLRLLCGVGLLRSIGNPVGSLLMAKGLINRSFRFNLFKMIFQIPGIIIGAYFGGSVGVAAVFLTLQLFYTYFSYSYLIKAAIGSSLPEYLLSLRLPLLLSLPMAAGIWIIQILNSELLSTRLGLAVQIVAGVIIYSTLLLIIKHPLIEELKSMFLKKFGRLHLNTSA